MEKRIPRDYWSRVLSEAGHQPVSCWKTVDEVLVHVRESKPDFLLTEPGFGTNRGFETENTAWSSNAEVRELPGNSHNEMRRSPESNFELNQAFNGLVGGNNFSIPFR